MGYGSRTRRRKGQGDGSDPFPDDIYDLIVSFLPIRDAIRSSLVSRAWRYRWRSVPRLIFDHRDDIPVTRSYEREEEVGQKNERFISRVLLLHKGRIEAFSVSCFLSDCGVMDVWIPALTVSGIQEFRFKYGYHGYSVHSDLFSFHGLTVLELCLCTLRVPSETEFNGFPNLTHLILQDIELDDPCDTRSLGPLITSCPKLKVLSLGEIVASHNMDNPGFEASAPSLERLELAMLDSYGPIYINAPKVWYAQISVVISFDCFVTYVHQDLPQIFTLISVLSRINYVERLVIPSIAVFPFSNVSSKLPFELPYLKDLELDASFECLDETIAAICLVRSAPMLTRLHVKSDEPVEFANDYWEIHDGESCKLRYLQDPCELNHLQLLEFESMKGSQEEMAFIMFVLKNAPSISKIDIRTESGVDIVEQGVEDLLTVIDDTAHGTLRINDKAVSF